VPAEAVVTQSVTQAGNEVKGALPENSGKNLLWKLLSSIYLTHKVFDRLSKSTRTWLAWALNWRLRVRPFVGLYVCTLWLALNPHRPALCQLQYINGGTTLKVICRDFKLDEAAGKFDQVYLDPTLDPFYEGISVNLGSYEGRLDRKVAFRRTVMSLGRAASALRRYPNVRESRNALLEPKENHAKIPVFRSDGKRGEYLFKALFRGFLKPSYLVDKKGRILNGFLSDRHEIKLSNRIRNESVRDEKDIAYLSDLAERFRVGHVGAIDGLAVCGHHDFSRGSQRGDRRTVSRGLGARGYPERQHKQCCKLETISIRSLYRPHLFCNLSEYARTSQVRPKPQKTERKIMQSYLAFVTARVINRRVVKIRY